MAKRIPASNKSISDKPAAAPVKKEIAKQEVVATTPVRNTPIPKAAKPAATTSAPKPITYEAISERAYFISQSSNAGSQDDNWHRAVAELNSENI